MAERDIEILVRARQNFVQKRRDMAEQMIPAGAMASHFGPAFGEIQSAIEAIDRAIADERTQPDEFHDRGPGLGDPADGSNVERVDFQAINNPDG